MAMKYESEDIASLLPFKVDLERLAPGTPGPSPSVSPSLRAGVWR